MQVTDAIRDMLPVEKVVSQGTKAIVIVVAAWVAHAVARRAIRSAARAAGERVEEEARRQRVTTLLLLVGSIFKYVIIFLAGLMVLKEVGLNPTPILAGAGVVGLAVGFGAQNLVRDVVSGFFIIMEGQYAVGDVVEINGVLGRVEEVGLRVTKMRDPVGQLRYFANGTITTANNYTEDNVAYVITVPVPPEEPADPIPLVRSILEDFEEEFRVFGKAPTLELDNLPTYSRVVRVKARAIPGRHTLLEQKLPARVAAGLERAGYALRPGTEVGVSPRFPPPGSKV